MKIRIIIAVIMIILLLLVVVLLTANKALMPVVEKTDKTTPPIENPTDLLPETVNVLNATYIFPREQVRLYDGSYTSNAPKFSDAYQQVSIFGAPIYADLDNDGDNDAILLLIQQNSGTGVFYYVTAAINQDNNYQGTNVILLGDRIAPQTLEFKDKIIMANYTDRGPEEAMTTPPSFDQTKYL